MRTAIALVIGCLAVSSTASAGGYLGLSLGTGPGGNDDFEARIGKSSGRSLRGLAGWRFAPVSFGSFSAEAALNGFDVLAPRYGEHTAYQLGASLKFNLPLGSEFEAFGRLGAERTWLTLNNNGFDFTGDGFVLGAGFEYRLNAVLANASIFVDYNIHHATMESVRFNVDDTLRIWSLGFTIGL